MTQTDVKWTAREALACAYCWSEFGSPEDRNETPEEYWSRISERARNDCRAVANELLLLSVVRKETVAMPPPRTIREDVVLLIGAKIGIKNRSRLTKILDGVYAGLRAARASDANADSSDA
jgi:hypothetical protein